MKLKVRFVVIGAFVVLSLVGLFIVLNKVHHRYIDGKDDEGEHAALAVEGDDGDVEIVKLIICTDGIRWPIALTTINSVLQNTHAKISLFAMTAVGAVAFTEHIIKSTPSIGPKLHTLVVRSIDTEALRKKILVRGNRKSLANPMNYARYYITEIFSELEGSFVFLDDDVIVQGDIKDLASFPLSGTVAAFGSDCNSIADKFNLFQNKYSGFINFENNHIAPLNMDPNACSFNAGVFVADATLWRKSSISQQLEYWMQLNTKENVYGAQGAGGGSQPPMLIVFYKKHAILPPLWHVRGLGSATGRNIPRDLVDDALLIHWTGKAKPWVEEEDARFKDIYLKYKVPLFC
eukprot:m.10690 g.10690  ORF g.10690 m.10690 type:complete len:348 (+) comp3712_c0_seq1:203-1246(+)